MTFEDFIKGYWDYYLELESRIEETRRFVEYDSVNFKTFSSNYNLLFQAICSEIDVVGKEIASYFDKSFSSKEELNSINKWWFVIQNNIPEVFQEIKFSDSFLLSPWENYKVDKKEIKKNINGELRLVTTYNLKKKANGITYSTPKWWNAYNKVKHERLRIDDNNRNYTKANFNNISNSIAALFLLEFEFIKIIGQTSERKICGTSKLFDMGDFYIQYMQCVLN